MRWSFPLSDAVAANECVESHVVFLEYESPEGYQKRTMSQRPSRREFVVDKSTITTFEDTAKDFARFAEGEGYPRRLLWSAPEDIVLWRGHYFVYMGDVDTRQFQAKARFDGGITKSVGICLEGKCKASGWTICRVYVP